MKQYHRRLLSVLRNKQTIKNYITKFWFRKGLELNQVAHLKNKLDVDFGEVTKDGKFSLKEVECIAACDKAPVIEVNGKQFKNVTTQSVDEILVSLKWRLVMIIKFGKKF